MKDCRVCKGKGPIAPSRVKRYDWICNTCAGRARYKKRRVDHLQRLAYNYYQRTHKKGVFTPLLSKEQVAKILKDCKITDPSNVSLYQKDGKIIAMSSTKARSNAHKKKKRKTTM